MDSIMKRTRMVIPVFVASTLGFSGTAMAQSHSDGMNHDTMDHSAMSDVATSGAPVSAPGQGAFAAIAEIVAQLESNPDTDWTIVDINALREHLRDMNVVTIDATAVAKEIEGGMEFSVTGTPEVAPSIRRMVLAHAAIMNEINGWKYSAKEIDGGALVTVIVPLQDQTKVKALGFFGIMATGSHHQEHHWMMASGHNPHG